MCQGIIDRPGASRIARELLDLRESGIPDSAFDARYEDIHAGIESLLVGAAGEDKGGRIHAGRSRNDEVSTCIRFRLRQEILRLLGLVVELRGCLLQIARDHTGTVMPGFTHLQHAQPTTLAHHLLAYEQALSRDSERLWGALERTDRCPLGAAAFAGTGYPIDREYTAGLLGFSGLLTNTMDAVSSRDFATETLAALAILAGTISRLCEELILWSSPLVRFVELDDMYCSTSSIMPQKKNPDVAELMRGRAGTVAGALSAVLMIMKALPQSYNRDLQELTPHLWRGVRSSSESLHLLPGMLSTARFDTARMREEAGRGLTTATDLADLLVRRYNLPFRTAHSIVGRAARAGEITLEGLDTASRELVGTSLSGTGLTPEEIREALDPAGSIAARSLPGGPAPETTAGEIRAREQALGSEQESIGARGRGVETAIARLIAEAERLAG
jgi:argininosuccinate lyase